MAIVPDEKDWTWVLERACPECGFEASELDRQDLAALILEVAGRWKPVLNGDELAIRHSPDVWSDLEYACHVRDVFRIFDERLSLMLELQDPTFPNWDQDAAAIENGYANQSPALVAIELGEAAARLAGRFASLEPEQWLRTGSRSNGSRFTVESMGRYMIHDPIHHLNDVDHD